jgi:hydrogenase expression/formation protein HypC
MCLSVPAKVLEINGAIARVAVGGAEVDAGLHLLDDVKPGDYVLLHTGYAIQKLSESEARETMQLLREFLGDENTGEGGGDG